jgi:hypothetical protein
MVTEGKVTAITGKTSICAPNPSASRRRGKGRGLRRKKSAPRWSKAARVRPLAELE